MSHVRREWVVENTWICTFCCHENRGRDLDCCNCGARKGAKVEDRIPDPATAPEVTDAALLAQAAEGAHWTCEFCGGKERDPKGNCTNCAAERSKAAEVLQMEEHFKQRRILDPEAVAASMKRAEDLLAQHEARKCEFCGDALPDDGPCTNCAAAREYVEKQTGVGYKPAPRNKPAAPTGHPYRDAPPEQEQEQPPGRVFLTARGYRALGMTPPWEQQGPSLWARLLSLLWRGKWWILGATGVLGLVWFLVWLFLPHEVDTTVTSTTWRYTAELQQRETRHDEDWDGNMRSGAFNVSCVTRQHGTHDCDPYTCNTHQESYSCGGHSCNCRTTCSNRGNGFSSCSETCSTCYNTCYRTVSDTCYHQCPTYDQWCDYDYYAWPTILTRGTEGIGKEVTWPVMPVPAALQRIVKTERYEVVFQHDEDTWTTKPSSLAAYRQFTRGTSWRIKVNHAGSVEPLRELP